jgi:hypothetical protein
MNGLTLFSKVTFRSSNLFWHFALWVQGAGVYAVLAPSGLDLGYNWAVTKATRENLFSLGEFVGPYGPFGFLEFAYPDWPLGFTLSIIWKLLLASVLMEILTVTILKQIKNLNLSYLLSMTLVTIIGALNMPNILLILIFVLRAIFHVSWFRNADKSEPFIDGSILLISFLIKPLPFVLVGIYSLMYYLGKGRLLRNLLLLAAYFTFIAVISFKLLGFNITSLILWFKGYLEISSGYTEMSYEDPARLLEYPMFVLMALYILFFIAKNERRVYLLLLTLSLYLVFRYGFNRHDGHSITSFSIILFIILAVNLKWNSEKKGAIYLSLISLLLVSGYNLGEILNTTVRTQNSYFAAKIISNPGFREVQLAQSKRQAISDLRLPPEVLNRIQGKEVGMLPLPEDISYANVKLSLPPVSQLFSAYTPWLDSLNADWVTSANSPEFFLLRPPTTIDGRFPWWDSPRFWVEVMCNYTSTVETEDWLLLSRRDRALCSYLDTVQSGAGGGDKISVETNTTDAITLLDLQQRENFLNQAFRLFFKPLSPDLISINGQNFRLVWKNQGYLPVNIPESINFPGKWRIGQIGEVIVQNFAEYKFLEIPITRARRL